MARPKKKGESEADGPVGWRELLSFGTLLVGVVGVLALGAILKTGSPTAHPSSTTAGPERNTGTDRPVVTLREDREMAPEDVPAPPVSSKNATPSRVNTSRPERRSSLVKTPRVSHDLVRRAQADLRRFTGDGDPWTLQLALLCDSSGAREALERFGSNEPFHVLPSLHDDRACFILSWNRYATRDAAKAASDLPDAIRSRYPGAFPKPIAEVVR
jgi:septal ring-binding cell division protein DamX